MACGIKAVYAIKNFFPAHTRIKLMNALVVSHFHYSVLLSEIKRSLPISLEEQLN